MTPLLPTLTAREEEVLRLLADGHGLREIASRWAISWWTVRAHKVNAMKKLGARTQSQAVAMLLAARGGA